MEQVMARDFTLPELTLIFAVLPGMIASLHP